MSYINSPKIPILKPVVLNKNKHQSNTSSTSTNVIPKNFIPSIIPKINISTLGHNNSPKMIPVKKSVPVMGQNKSFMLGSNLQSREDILKDVVFQLIQFVELNDDTLSEISDTVLGMNITVGELYSNYVPIAAIIKVMPDTEENREFILDLLINIADSPHGENAITEAGYKNSSHFYKDLQFYSGFHQINPVSPQHGVTVVNNNLNDNYIDSLVTTITKMYELKNSENNIQLESIRDEISRNNITLKQLQDHHLPLSIITKVLKPSSKSNLGVYKQLIDLNKDIKSSHGINKIKKEGYIDIQHFYTDLEKYFNLVNKTN
jgi:hypothetical protein